MADQSQPSIRLLQDPLVFMRIRAECKPSHKFGKVRNGGTRVHQGWDLEAKVGTPIYAVSDGTIEFVSTLDQGAYGKQVCLKFAYGPKTYYAFYGHLSDVKVKAGDAVSQGDELGLTGKTGNASNMPVNEEHLHFEIRTHKRVLDIVDPTPQTVDALMKLDLSAGVDVEIKL